MPRRTNTVTWTHAEIIAALGLMLSVIVFWTGTRKAKRDMDPVVETAIKPLPAWPGWYQLQITINNRAPFTLQCLDLEALRPMNLKIISAKASGGTQTFLGLERLPNKPPPKSAARKVPLELRAGPLVYPQDNNYGTVLIGICRSKLFPFGMHRVSKCAFRLHVEATNRAHYRNTLKIAVRMPAKTRS